ncbi:MAG: hypothetical protein WEB13_05895, partial [Dehalococcoidia bacterium]
RDRRRLPRKRPEVEVPVVHSHSAPDDSRATANELETTESGGGETPAHMSEHPRWNVAVSVREEGYNPARRLLREFGVVGRTGYFNLLLLRVDDRAAFLDAFSRAVAADPAILELQISRVVPAEETFSFQSPEEFEERAREIAAGWAGRLAGSRFHVRLHRRGFRGRLSSQDEERFLDHVLLDALERIGEAGWITFEDPDAILSVETVSNWAGMSLWTRDELTRYPFVRLD